MHKQNNKDIKLFGLAFTILLSLLSIKLYKSGNLFYKNITVVSGILFILSLFAPKIILPVYKIFHLFGNFVIRSITNIVLIAVFYLVITPIGIFLRLCKKDLLSLRKNDTTTYWLPRHEAYDKNRYAKQF
jgi:hypothetical protein